MEDDHTMYETTVRGIVVPAEWDDRGKVLHVAILTPDEGQYDVSDSGFGRCLLAALREEIEACICIDQTQMDRRQVTILSYRVVDEDDDDSVVADFLRKPDTAE